MKTTRKQHEVETFRNLFAAGRLSEACSILPEVRSLFDKPAMKTQHPSGLTTAQRHYIKTHIKRLCGYSKESATLMAYKKDCLASIRNYVRSKQREAQAIQMRKAIKARRLLHPSGLRPEQIAFVRLLIADHLTFNKLAKRANIIDAAVYSAKASYAIYTAYFYVSTMRSANTASLHND